MTRNNHRQRIHEAIRTRLLRGEIGPGEKLVDHAIAAEMGVSRMPVREALMQLASEGYLDGTSRGFALPELSADRIAEVFVLRRLLEPHAAACAARDLSSPAVASLETALLAATRALPETDPGAFHRACETFRNTWLQAVGNAELRQAIQRYSGQVQSVRFATLPDPVARKTILDGLAALLAAFRATDGPLAAECMLRFIFAAEDAYSRQNQAKGAAR